MGDPLDRILGKLDDMSQRVVAVEVRQANNEVLTARQDALERDINGVGRKIDLHEASPGHGVTIARLEAIEKAVAYLRELEAVTRTLNEHMQQAEQRRQEDLRRGDERRRWLMGLTATVALTLLTTLAKAFGWIP